MEEEGKEADIARFENTSKPTLEQLVRRKWNLIDANEYLDSSINFLEKHKTDT